MAAIVYYLVLPLFYLISLLPFRVLYVLSSGMYIILYSWIGYRKKVVYENLHNSFPEKTEAEIETIAKAFYLYFCDLILETIKTLTITPASVKKRITFQDTTPFEKYYKQNQSVIIVMGHYGNWELGGAGFSQLGLHPLYVIYHPLSNKYFDKLVYHMRTRLGNKLYAMNDVLRAMLRDRDKITATAFIADQTPSHQSVYWTSFLNQDTPIFTGPAKIARKLNYPIIYVSIQRPKRGRYNLITDVLVDNPNTLSEDEISEMHTKRLEQDIQACPEIWLWTHRRWKIKRNKDK